MSVLWYLLIGIVVGILARIIIPGKENMGWFMTVLLGALGAFLAGSIGTWTGWYPFPSVWGFIAAVIVAIILIAIYARIKGKK
jgi:uncharacterized membrane protein YeaQ/YmgE (transglycosylase-associated protein family)